MATQLTCQFEQQRSTPAVSALRQLSGAQGAWQLQLYQFTGPSAFTLLFVKCRRPVNDLLDANVASESSKWLCVCLCDAASSIGSWVSFE